MPAKKQEIIVKAIKIPVLEFSLTLKLAINVPIDKPHKPPVNRSKIT